MAKILIASSANDGYTSNCGFSGVVPPGEEWYRVLVDNNHGAQGEHLVVVAGETATINQCHVSGVSIGRVNGVAFHFMRKYSIGNILYDCINGACTPTTKYQTLGLYKSLAECEEACGTGCSGKCISNSEWAQIEGLSGQLKSRNCS